MFEATVTDGVMQLYRPNTRWLSTGWDGGSTRADAMYNVTVPEGWERTDIRSYVDERRERSGFTADGPTLLTGVDMRHARGARLDPVVAYATVGLSNPAALPVDPLPDASPTDPPEADEPDTGDRPGRGTVNIVVGTTRRLPESARANLVAVVAESKAATLLSAVNVPGTTTDAIVVADDETGTESTFSGSATAVGAAARVCVRDAVLASFRSRYATSDPPQSVDDAEYGVVADQRAEVFTP